MSDQTPDQQENEQTEQTGDEAVEQQDGALQEQQEDEIAYEFQAEDTDALKKKVTVTVPRGRIDAKLDEMFGELGGTAQVPGFRIGHAPRRLVEKRFGKDVSHDVRNALVGESLGYVLDKADFKVLGEPDLELEEIELPSSGDMEYSFEIEVAPTFELPGLDGIVVEKRLLEVTDEVIDEHLDQLRQGRGVMEPTDEAAAEGDGVVVNTTVSGEEIGDPVKSEGIMLRVAPGQVEGLPLVDLGTQLAGKKAGQTVTMTVDVPQAHANEDWRGKKADVEIEIVSVRRRILPELDEQFASAMGFDSIDEMRKFVADRMETRTQSETQRNMREQVCDHLLDNTDFELPKEMAARYAARTLQRHYVDLLYQGVPREKLEENMTQLKASADERAARDLKLEFILAKIAREQGFEASEDEVNSRIAQMAATSNRRPERVRQELESDGTIGQIESQLIEEKVLEMLLAKADITEVAAEAGDDSDKAPTKAKPKKKSADKTSKKEAADKTPSKKKATSKTPEKKAD